MFFEEDLDNTSLITVLCTYAYLEQSTNYITKRGYSFYSRSVQKNARHIFVTSLSSQRHIPVISIESEHYSP
jgi:hypothetical protein